MFVGDLAFSAAWPRSCSLQEQTDQLTGFWNWDVGACRCPHRIPWYGRCVACARALLCGSHLSFFLSTSLPAPERVPGLHSPSSISRLVMVKSVRNQPPPTLSTLESGLPFVARDQFHGKHIRLILSRDLVADRELRKSFEVDGWGSCLDGEDLLQGVENYKAYQTGFPGFNATLAFEH